MENWEEPKTGGEGFDEDVLMEGDAEVAYAVPRAEKEGEEEVMMKRNKILCAGWLGFYLQLSCHYSAGSYSACPYSEPATYLMAEVWRRFPP